MAITVTGKVQGVYYRQSTKEKAGQLGLAGIVQNQDDGSVFILATGSADQLQALVEWCKTGPPRAVVTAVTGEERPLQNFAGFHIKR